MDPVQTSEYSVKTSVFEGPLEVLLELIEKRKLFVNEVSLAQVTDDYISYVKNLAELPAGEATNFVVIAATLIFIKSRSLLPNMELTPDEEKEIVNLEDRLKLFQFVTDAGAKLKDLFGKNIMYPKPEREAEIPVFSPHPSISVKSMYESIGGVLLAMPKKENLPQIQVKKIMSIDEMLDDLALRMQTAVSMSFRDFASRTDIEDPKERKVYAIVSFLAMLELVRQGLISVVQDNDFDDINLYKETSVTVSVISEN